ncbi:hypothetical protein NHQ30_008609 [Ciborinia camelliae]|nr:hypothetical protein NHQ30_008609 [Ciborinia camelliae]
MSNSDGTTNDSFIFVKLIRSENGQETSSIPIPIQFQASADLRTVYRTIWDYFSDIEQNGIAHDRVNIPLGAGLREGDDIEGLRVTWHGLTSDSWPVNEQQILITQQNFTATAMTEIGCDKDVQDLSHFFAMLWLSMGSDGKE